jgi:hypothetical protein
MRDFGEARTREDLIIVFTQDVQRDKRTSSGLQG